MLTAEYERKIAHHIDKILRKGEMGNLVSDAETELYDVWNDRTALLKRIEELEKVAESF
jgi:hypothetical protein